MKFSKKLFTKLASYTFLFVITVTMQNCTVDIPETDTDPPQFSFKISGDGYEHTFDHTTDYDGIQLNLREDAEYTFILTGSDSGGVKEIQWQYPHDYIEFVNPISSPWTISRTSGLSSEISWQGDASNALTGNILTGKFKPNGEQVAFNFYFSVKDFGGESGTVNTFSASLNLFSGNHNTEIINF